MRRFGTALFGLLLLGCPPQLDDPEDDPIDAPPADSGQPGEGDPDGDASLLGDSLQGMDIVVEEDGPWVVRRSGSGATGVLVGLSDDEDGGVAEMLSTGSDSSLGAPRGGPGSRGSGLGGSAMKAGRTRDAEPAEGYAPEPEAAPAPTAELERRRETSTPTTTAQAALRAGATDDNADFEAFLTFLAGWSDDTHVASQWDELDVSDRRHLRVADPRGNPAPGVEVTLIDEARDKVVWSGTTYGDGSLPFYPRVAARELADAGSMDAPEAGFLVQVTHGDERTTKRWNGIGDELLVEIASPVDTPATIPLDVLFLIDTTGSMGDEIARIKATLLRVTERLRGLEQEFDLHYAAVLYRDIGDDYVTKAHPFTADIETFVTTLQGVQANGGGDGPESLNQGLAHAVSMDGWRDGAAKVMFLIADAPPHMDYEGDTDYGQSLLGAVDRGIRIHSVAASGLDSFGTVVMRQTAQFTGGKFIFIEYGSTAASAASHGVTGSVSSNNLDDIIYQQIAGELAGWGQPTTAIATR